MNTFTLLLVLSESLPGLVFCESEVKCSHSLFCSTKPQLWVGGAIKTVPTLGNVMNVVALNEDGNFSQVWWRFYQLFVYFKLFSFS